jgi:hypothetical protein
MSMKKAFLMAASGFGLLAYGASALTHAQMTAFTCGGSFSICCPYVCAAIQNSCNGRGPFKCVDCDTIVAPKCQPGPGTCTPATYVCARKSYNVSFPNPCACSGQAACTETTNGDQCG